MRKLVKPISIVLTIAYLILIPFNSFASTGNSNDSTLLNKWKNLGLIDKSVTASELNQPIEKIDLIKFINTILNVSKQADIDFVDVPKDSWYGKEIAKAVASGYVDNKEKTKFYPFSSITRLDAAIMVTKVFGLELDDKKLLDRITDAEKLDAQQLTAFGAVIEKGYLSEISKGRYAPLGVLKLVDAMKLLDKCIGLVITKSSTITSDKTGNILINASPVVLKNMELSGDLIIGDIVAEGTVTLENVTVKGKVIVRGGGPNGIIIKNSRITGDLIVEKFAGNVNIIAQGTTTIEQTYLKSGGKLSESNLSSGKGFVNVIASKAVNNNQIASLNGEYNSIKLENSNINVVLNGKSENVEVLKETTSSFSLESGAVNNITIKAAKSKVKLLNGKVTTLNVEEGAKGNNIELNGVVTVSKLNVYDTTAINFDKGTIETLIINSSSAGTYLGMKSDAYVKNLVASSAATISGLGKIDNVHIYANDVNIEIRPSSFYVASGIVAYINGTIIDPTKQEVLFDIRNGNITSLKVNETEQLIIDSLWPSNSTVSYVSSDNTIATVSEKGVITGVSLGTTKIHVSVQCANYNPKVQAIEVTVVSNNTTDIGTLEVSPNSGEAGTYEDFTITYTAGDNMSNGTVYIRLPAGFMALESDTVSIGNSAQRALGTSWQKPDTLIFTNLNLTKGEKIIVTLKNKEVPAGGQYEFSSTSDADSEGPKQPTTDSKAVFTSDNLKSLKEKINYTIPEYGSKAGTTKISTLSFEGLGAYINEGFKWLIKVQNGEFTSVPKFNDELSVTKYSEYKQGDNIPVVNGQYLMLIAADRNNKLKAYKIIRITDGTNDTPKMIRPDDAVELKLGTNYDAPASGVQAGTVRIAGLNYAGSDHFMVKVQDAQVASVFVDTEFVGAAEYTSGNDIKVKANQHVLLAAVDKNNRIKAFKDIQVDVAMIGKEAGKLEAGINFANPEKGSMEGTTKIEWLSKGDVNGGFPSIVNWMTVVIDKAAIIPAKNALATDYEKYYLGGNTFSSYAEKADIPVAPGKHILLVGVNADKQIQAYVDMVIGPEAVAQADAPEIPDSNYETPVMGSMAGATMFPRLDFSTAISGATKYMVWVQNDVFDTPQINSTLTGSVNCVQKQNINITSGQHLILVATDDAGRIKAYTDITVDNTDNTQIRPEDVLKLTIAENDYLSPAPGTEDGSTMIVLYSNGIPRDKVKDTRTFAKWMYKTQDAQFAVPYDGSDIPGGMKDYTSGDNIKDISAGQHLVIIAVDTNNKILAYIDEVITANQIKQAKATVIPNCSDPVQGLAKGTTRIMTLNFQSINGANNWLYKISSTPIDAPDYNSVLPKTGLEVYVEGANIPITKDKYIIMYAVDNLTDRRVKAYKNILVTENQIKVEVPILNLDTGFTNYIAPIKGTNEGTTVLSSLSFEGVAGAAPLRWEYAVGDTTFIAPVKNATLTDSGFVTKEYIPGTNIEIKAGQFILLLAVDNNNVIQGFASIPVAQGQIKPSNANEIMPSNYTLLQGTTEGTTRFANLNTGGLSTEVTKWMIKTQKTSFDIVTNPIGRDTKVSGAIDYNSTTNPDIKISEGEYILLLATDKSGFVKAYTEIKVAKAQIKNPFAMDLLEFVNTNYVGPQPGTSPGATSITLVSTGIPTEDEIVWKYKIGTTAFSKPHLDDDASAAEYKSYSSNEDIMISPNNFLLVVAVNKSNSAIKAYLQFKITDTMIMPADAGGLVMKDAANVNGNYTAPVPGSEPGTTKISYLNPIGLTNVFDHWVIKVFNEAQTIALNSIISYPTSSNYSGGNISVQKGQYVVLAAVDANNRVKAYKNIVIEEEHINPPLAPDILATNYSSPKSGTDKGTTSIKVSPDGVTYVLKVADAGEYIKAGQLIEVSTTSTGSDYSSFRKYTSNTDISAKVGQVIILVEIDADNKAVAYKNIPINNAVNPGMATELILNKNFLKLQPGTGAGTTVLAGLDAFNISGFTKWAIKVSDSAPAIPMMNSSVLNGKEYIGSTDTIEVKVNQGQVVELYALASDGSVKGYAFIAVGTDDVKGVATRIYPVPVPGTSVNTVKFESAVLDPLLVSITGATKWKYAVLNSAPEDILKDSKLNWVTDYTKDTDILAAEGKHLILVATDADGLSKAYADIAITSNMLKGINVSVTGTITDSTGESDIVAGGKTIIITLDSGEWVDDIFTNSDKLKLLFNGFTPTVTDTQWKNVVAGFNIVPMNPVNKKVITIRLSECNYDITTNRQISLKIDKSLIKNADKDITLVNAFTIGADVVIKTLTGTAITPGLTKDDIVAGGKTIFVELTVGEFAADIDTDSDKREAIFNGLTTSNTNKAVRDKIVQALKLSGEKAIKWNSKTKLTITLPAISDFTLDSNEVLSLTIPCKAAGKEILLGAVKDATASTQIIISANTSVSMSGTLVSTPVSEADIVKGGKTLVITLTSGQWAADIATNEDMRNNLFTGLKLSGTTDSTQWGYVIAALKDAALVANQKVITRNNDSTVTINMPAVLSGYKITKNQNIKLTIPASCIVGAKAALTAGETITVEKLATATLSGTAVGTAVTETNIKAGGATIIVTLSNDAIWVDDVATDETIRNALLDGFKADVETEQWLSIIDKLKLGEGIIEISSTNPRVLTITLPSSDYDISKTQTISVTVPASAVIGTSFDVTLTNKLTINSTPPAATQIKEVTAATGTYKAGDVIPIKVVFQDAVDVTGTPVLKLKTGTASTNITEVKYTSGTGSNELIFNYEVKAGDNSDKLSYIGTTALVIPTGSTIKNKGINIPALLELPALTAPNSLSAANICVDGIAPQFITNYPQSGNKTETTAEIILKLNERGTVYYAVVLDDGSTTVPTVQQVMEWTIAPVLDGGVYNVDTDSETLSISNLSAYTKYKVYFVNVDDNGNRSSVTTYSIQTLDLTAPVVRADQVAPIYDNKIDITVTVSETGKVYLIALPSGSVAPASAEEVKKLATSGTTVATNLRATKAVTKDTNVTITLTGLSVSSHYDIYLISEDNSLNLSYPILINAETSKLDLSKVDVELAKGILTNTNELMQYSFDGLIWKACTLTNTNITYNDNAEILTIFIREEKNISNMKSFILTRAENNIDTALIDYDIAEGKIINNSSTNLQYRFNDGNWKAFNSSPTGLNVIFEPGSFSVRTAATSPDGVNKSQLPSAAKVVVYIPEPMTAPDITFDDTTNTINGLLSTHEYSIDGGSWVNGLVEGDFAGTKNVRVREKATKFKLPSAVKEIQFTACALAVVAHPAADDTTLNKNFVTITFEENTNKANKTLTAQDIEKMFLVGKTINGVFEQHNWGTDVKGTFNSTGKVLTITFNSMEGSTVEIGDEVNVLPAAEIQNTAGTSGNYSSKGKLTGSFHTVPKILSIKAVNTNNDTVFSDGEQLVITFDQATSKNAITANNIANYLILTDAEGKSTKKWDTKAASDPANLTVAWTSNRELTITFKDVTKTELLVGDKIRVSSTWGLTDEDATTGVCSSSAIVGGSFTSTPKIIPNGVIMENGGVSGKLDAGDKIKITFDQATNAPVMTANTLINYFKLVSSDGKTVHYLGVQNNITWSADFKTLTIKLENMTGVTLQAGDKLSILSGAGIKSKDGSTAACVVSDISIGGSY